MNDDTNERLAKKLDEYATSFTVHGISRIYTGNTIEKILWSIFVLTAVAGSAIVLNNYVQKHLRHEVMQAFTSEITKRAYYPQVTFCLDNLRSQLVRLHCGYDFTNVLNYTDCKRGVLDCSVTKRKLKGRWSNGLFNVYYVRNGEKVFDNQFSLANHLDGHEAETKGICTTWHFNKTFHQIISSGYYSTFSIVLEVPQDLLEHPKREISVIINEQNVSGIYQREQLHIVPEFTYHLQLSKIVIYRKEKPFPSNCSHQTNINGFPGAYNRETCLLINNDLEIFKKYGITRDITKLFIPSSMRSKYNKNWKSGTSAFRNAFSKFFENVDLEDSFCPLPCHETTFDFSVITKPSTVLYQPYKYDSHNVDIDEVAGKQCFNLDLQFRSPSFFRYELHLHYKNPHIFTKIEEKELYPRDEMLGEVGGFLGLMIGASCISLLELIAFVIIASLKKCYR